MQLGSTVPDDPRERVGRQPPVALLGQRLGALQKPDRDVRVERARAGGTRGEGSVVAPPRRSRSGHPRNLPVPA